MRFIVENANLGKLNETLKTVAQGTKDAKVNLLLGAQDLGANVRNSARITTTADQIQAMFDAKKPEGFEVKPENVINIDVDATKFLAIIGMTLTYKSDIFIDVMENQIVIGVEGRCKTPLAIEVGSTSPIAQSKLLFKVDVTTSNLNTLLSRGCGFADETGDLSAATIQFISQVNMLVGYSTNGAVFSRAMVEADFGKDTEDEKLKALNATMAANIEAVTAENGKDKVKYPVSLPKTVVNHLSALINGRQKVTIFVDDLHVHCQLDPMNIYSANLAAGGAPTATIDTVLNKETSTQVGVDLNTLMTGVDYINNIDAISGNANKYPVKVTPVGGDEGKLILTSEALSELESVVKPTKVVGNDSFAVAGKNLKAVLTAFSKGGVVLAVTDGIVTIYNGTVDSIDRNSVVGIVQVNTVTEDTEESEEATEE